MSPGHILTLRALCSIPMGGLDAEPIGRAEEIAFLRRATLDVVRGQKRALVLSGSAGIGKSTLLQWSARTAQDHGLICVVTRAPTIDGLPPLFPMHQVIEQLAERIPQSFNGQEGRSSDEPVGGPIESGGQTLDLFHIVQVLNAVGQMSPIGIFLDDVHWAPTEGLALLISALRLVDRPVLCVMTARELKDGSPWYSPESTGDLPVDCVKVAGISPDSVGDLAHHLLDLPPLPSLTQLLYDRSLGNPLFVTEMLRAWRESGQISRRSNRWTLTDSSSPPDNASLLDMISGRLHHLTPELIAPATILALLGRAASAEELETMVDISPNALADILGVLDEIKVVTRNPGDGLHRLAHPLFQEALLMGLNETRKAALHGRIFTSMSSADCSAAELAYHAVRALRPPGELLSLLRAAAKDAESVGSYAEAADWHKRIAKIAPDDATLYDALAGCALALERFDPGQAAEVYGQALELAPNGKSVRSLIGRARARRMAGQPEVALQDLEDAKSSASAIEKLEIRDMTAVIHAVLGETDAAAVQFADLAEETIGTPLHARALSRLAIVAYLRGNIARAKALALDALTETVVSSDFWHLRMNLAWFLALLGEWDDAGVVVGEAIKRAKHAKDFWLLAPLMTTATDLAVWKGDFETALDLGEQVCRVAVEAYDMDKLGALAALGLTLLEQGRPDQASRVLEPAPDMAASAAEKNEVHQSLIVLAESLLGLDDLDGAARLIEQVRGYLHYNMSWKAAADRVNCQLLILRGEPTRALQAIGDWLRSPSEIPYEQARIQECAAAANLALGLREDARVHAMEAFRIYSHLGATARKKRTEGWLRANSPRRLGRPRSRVVLNLTAREAEILALVGSGYSNNEIATKLFISPGTVKKHVSNIKVKTSVRHRRELISIAARVASSLEGAASV